MHNVYIFQIFIIQYLFHNIKNIIIFVNIDIHGLERSRGGARDKYGRDNGQLTSRRFTICSKTISSTTVLDSGRREVTIFFCGKHRYCGEKTATLLSANERSEIIRK